MADVCRLYTVREDSGRGEVVYDLSALFADATSADGQRCIRIGRLQPISPAEGVPQNIATLCSRKHAELSVSSHALLLRDGGGINGTFVNDKRLPAHTPTPLHDGDTISFGGGRILQQLDAMPNPMQFIVSNPQALLTSGGQQAGAAEGSVVQLAEDASHSHSPMPAPAPTGLLPGAAPPQTASEAVAATAVAAPVSQGASHRGPSSCEPALDNPSQLPCVARSSMQGTPARRVRRQRRLPRSLQSSSQEHQAGSHQPHLTAEELAVQPHAEAAAAGQSAEVFAMQQQADNSTPNSADQHAAMQGGPVGLPALGQRGLATAANVHTLPDSSRVPPSLLAAAEAGLRRAELDSGRSTPAPPPPQQQQQQADHQLGGTPPQQPDMHAGAAPQGLRARVQRMMSQQDNWQAHAEPALEQEFQASPDSVNGSSPAAGGQPSSTPAAAVVVSSEDEAPSVGPPHGSGQHLYSTRRTDRAAPHPSHVAAEERAAFVAGIRQLPHRLLQSVPRRRRLQPVGQPRPDNAEVINLLDSDESGDEVPQRPATARLEHPLRNRQPALAHIGSGFIIPAAVAGVPRRRQHHDEATSAGPETLRPGQVARTAAQQDAPSAAAAFAASQAASPAAPALAKLAAVSSACASEPEAAAPPAGGDTTRALEEQFECTICRDWMVATHSMVPCGHMFCGACLGDWLPKKPTCPTCRITLEAPPVRSWAVDGLLDSLVAPTLAPGDRAERACRKADWDRQATATTKRWKGLFDAPRHAAAEAGGRGGAFMYMPGLGIDMGTELRQMLNDMGDMGVMRRNQNAQRHHRRRAAAVPTLPLPAPMLHGGAAVQAPQASRLRSSRRRVGTLLPAQQPQHHHHHQQQPPHQQGLGAYMPGHPPQQVGWPAPHTPRPPQHEMIDSALVEYANAQDANSRNRICMYCHRRINNGQCQLRDSGPPYQPGTLASHRGRFAYHLRCTPMNTWAQLSGLPAGFGLIAPEDQAYLRQCYTSYGPHQPG